MNILVSLVQCVTLILILGAASVVLVACTALGTGRSTLVLAAPETTIYKGQEFEHLIQHDGMKLIGLQGKEPGTEQDWQKFQKERLGGTGKGAFIDINVRDQTNTPPLDLFNVETVAVSDVARILTDHTLTSRQKEDLLNQLRDNFRGMPETYSRFVMHGVDKGNFIYYYFPQITVDLTGALNTAETLDRFDFIAAAIRIPDAEKEKGVKFINFYPKTADLFDFTLGQLKQTASATAGANASSKATTNASITNKPTGGPETARLAGSEFSYGGSFNLTLTDELTRDMKSSLEARSAGIMENGQLFLIELRSNEQKRIAGTYSFNVMLQVPSTVTNREDGKTGIKSQSSTPKVNKIEAEVRVVGIVRHVVKPGKTGILKKVPEPLNDDTYREVVLRDKPVTLWEFFGPETGQVITDNNLTVYSNVDGASFTVVDEKDNRVLGYGTGRTAHLAINTKNTVKVVFVPVIVGTVALKAPDVTGITLGKDTIAIGSYLP